MTTKANETQGPSEARGPVGRQRVSLTLALLALVVSVAAGLLLRTVLMGPEAADAQPSAAIDEHAHHSAEHDHAAHDHAGHAHGPAGDAVHPPETTPVNNANCPVMGGPVDPAIGVAFNGWWISFCCPGCDEMFLADVDAYAAELVAATGTDIHRSPQAVAQEAAWQRGPNGTRDLANEHDPVSGESTHADVGVEVNGWWVRLASPASIRVVVHELDRYADVLLDATGVDVRRKFEATSPPSRQRGDGRLGGDNGTTHEADTAAHEPSAGTADADAVDIGNERCPVMDSPVAQEVTATYNGWRIHFCCPGCDGRFLANPEGYADKLMAQTGHDIRRPANVDR